jgi:hypothetical protein
MRDDPVVVALGFFVWGAVLASIVFRSVLPLVVAVLVFLGLGLLAKLFGDK